MCIGSLIRQEGGRGLTQIRDGERSIQSALGPPGEGGVWRIGENSEGVAGVLGMCGRVGGHAGTSYSPLAR